MSIQIRKPLSDEYSTISQMINQAFSVSPLPLTLDFFEDPKINCFIAVSNKEILGTATLHIIQKSNRKMGLIEDVVVHPKQQGKGVGKLLMEELLTKAKKLGCYKTILNSTESNQVFYEKLGFSKEQLQMTKRH